MDGQIYSLSVAQNRYRIAVFAFCVFHHQFSSDPLDMNEEVLKIINEPDQQFDSDIDLSLYDINDLLEEEEVEIE